MREESSGTIRYFSFIQYILNMMDNGGVFIVDEISARLHPVLTKFIVDLYQSEKNKKAQLVFTTHDISLMNRKQLNSKGGKSQYQDVCFPVTKEFREKLYDALMDCYQQEREKSMNQGMEQAATQSMGWVEMRQPDRNLPFR